jgi:hypothetical protein
LIPLNHTNQTFRHRNSRLQMKLYRVQKNVSSRAIVIEDKRVVFWV